MCTPCSERVRKMCAPHHKHPPPHTPAYAWRSKTPAPDRRSEHPACTGAYAKQAPRHQRTHPRTRSLRRVWHEFRHAILSTKNAHAPVHARICNRAETSLPWKLFRTYLESCASIVQAAVDRPPCCWLDEICCPTMFAQEIRPNPR